MNHLEQAMELNRKAGEAEGHEKTQLLILAMQSQCLDLHEETNKLRKELRTRNVTSSASLDFEGPSPSDGGEDG